MELKTERTDLSLVLPVADLSVEQPLEGEAVLPDYLPALSRVLCCPATPMLLQKSVTPTGVTVDGEVRVRILYTAADGSLNGYSHTLPFSKSVELNDAADYSVAVRLSLSYLNYRPTGERRIDLRGAVSVEVIAKAVEKNEVLTEACGDGVMTDCETVEFLMPQGRVEKTVLLDETLRPDDAAPIDRILNDRMDAVITECKTIGGKLIVKGEARLHLLYTVRESGRPAVLNAVLPFSQVADAPGIGEDSGFVPTVRVLSTDLRTKEDDDGEDTVFTLEAVLGVEACLYRKAKIAVLTDTFSTCYELEKEEVTLHCPTARDTVCEGFLCKKMLPFGEEGATVPVDAWAETAVTSVTPCPDGAQVCGTVTLKLLAADADNTVVYSEKSVEFSRTVAIGGLTDDTALTAALTVGSVTALPTGEGIEAQVNLNVAVTAMPFSTVTALTALSVDKENGKKPVRGFALAVYYACAGERIWDIAKRYDACPDSIRKVCGIEEDILTRDRMLLIPCV